MRRPLSKLELQAGRQPAQIESRILVTIVNDCIGPRVETRHVNIRRNVRYPAKLNKITKAKTHDSSQTRRVVNYHSGRMRLTARIGKRDLLDRAGRIEKKRTVLDPGVVRGRRLNHRAVKGVELTTGKKEARLPS